MTTELLGKYSLFLAFMAVGSFHAVLAFAHDVPPSAALFSASLSSTLTDDHIVPADRVKEWILSGRVYIHDDFLAESQLKLLQRGTNWLLLQMSSL
jgi:hypothetical protein